MQKHTPFYDLHLKANAKMVDFAGFSMPLHYGSQLEEHNQVRRDVGMFDVSHMGVLDLKGQDASQALRYLIANNIDRIQIGQALYTCLLNEEGGILDDLIVYKIADDFYRLVINASMKEKDIAWMKAHTLSLRVTWHERTDLAMLAIQGPHVQDKIRRFLLGGRAETILNLKPFTFAMEKDYFVARTGYTGEAGFEIIFPADMAASLWETCLLFDVQPCGLGARDTLRLEAGLNLYGRDMDESVTPLESNLAWTVGLTPERPFIGKAVLEKQLASGVTRQLVGLVLEEKGMMRDHQVVRYNGRDVGEVTSGGYAPTLQTSIALARISLDVAIGSSCEVEIRHQWLKARLIKPPFVRHGKKMF